MKEATRTSILSRRWLKVWTLIPVLNFDAQQTLNDVQLETKTLETERTSYVNWVNQVLSSCKGTPKMHKFRIRFDLDKSFGCDIDRWVTFAIEKKAEIIELDLRDYFDTIFKKKYTFPFKYYQKQLRSRNIGFPGCSCLTSLQLANVNVTGEVVEYFLSNCLLLECLYIAASDLLVNLKVDGPSLRLKYLDIKYCFSIKNVEISAVNLISFKYFGPKISMPLKCAPRLAEMLIGGSYSHYLIHNYYELSHYLYQLETLSLDVCYSKVTKDLQFPVLTNLRRLELITNTNDEESLLGFTFLIEASPFLHKFTLKFHWYASYIQREAEEPKRCPHQHLKEVEFIGFVGEIIDVELAMYIIENAVRLERFVFDTRKPHMIGSPWEFEETKEKRLARRRAQRLLSKLHPNFDFVVV
ncbi:hypothetical protein JCGZ_12116 [Jatropha curcas]|uniref:At1g61320/AtMIF1 LRR domain-containing protein n=2 Tax=Jatropha curcas TaxID=180498 RepID=A0A067KLZ8_JATCU|nr:hypothetical protein JCGZ_12116 [Jatropha curcas]